MKLNTQMSRLVLAAGLVSGAAAVHAANGFTVRPNDESMAKVGMTTSEVQQALGRPDRIIKRRNKSNSQTWTYRVVGKSAQNVVFDVDFDADGKVKSVGERIDPPAAIQ